MLPCQVPWSIPNLPYLSRPLPIAFSVIAQGLASGSRLHSCGGRRDKRDAPPLHVSYHIS